MLKKVSVKIKNNNVRNAVVGVLVLAAACAGLYIGKSGTEYYEVKCCRDEKTCLAPFIGNRKVVDEIVKAAENAKFSCGSVRPAKRYDAAALQSCKDDGKKSCESDGATPATGYLKTKSKNGDITQEEVAVYVLGDNIYNKMTTSGVSKQADLKGVDVIVKESSPRQSYYGVKWIKKDGSLYEMDCQYPNGRFSCLASAEVTLDSACPVNEAAALQKFSGKCGYKPSSKK